jgi:Methyltransferase FkbM domain
MKLISTGLIVNHNIFILMFVIFAIYIILGNMKLAFCKEGFDRLFYDVDHTHQHTSNLPTKSISQLDLPPGTTKVILNIGSNIDPILPRIADGPCAISIAFEPLVYSLIDYHPQLYVIPSAVTSDTTGVSTMYDYGRKSVSSSLLKAIRPAKWNGGLTGEKGGGRPRLVPILRLVDILDAIPSHLPISFLMTDVQGHDFELIQSAIQTIRRRGVRALQTEVFLDQMVTFQNATNDLCLHWMPLMTEHGYILESLFPPRENYASHQEAVRTCQNQLQDFYANRGGKFVERMKEWDARWRLASIEAPLGDSFFREHAPYHPNASVKLRRQWNSFYPVFSDEEYESCNAVTQI